MTVHVTNSTTPHLGGNVQGGDAFTWYPKLWQFLVHHFNVKSILDIGCAEGHATSEFKQLGCRAIGLDGLTANCKATLTRGCEVICLDLTRGYCTLNVDLVWCCEVVEHIAREHLDNLLATMRSGRVIAMTHALPNQDGYHHVNCQLPQYWLEAICASGYTYLPDETTTARSISHHYFQNTGLIFNRN